MYEILWIHVFVAPFNEIKCPKNGSSKCWKLFGISCANQFLNMSVLPTNVCICAKYSCQM